ncbi:MAG: metalloregulator ArsR/SmtB family transcription factor [Alphaproteobacteria bacterium]|nr:metalloregulator ArsR/SmtB family transcription factor [Alphaproteobacteria bacterium]
MEQALDIFRALADPTRLRILALVRRMELAVGEMAQVLRQSQPRVSRHVKILADAGLVARHKEGAWVFVRLGDPSRVEPVLAALDAWSAGATSEADLARLAAVRDERAAAANGYFEAHAAEWDEIRSLHVADAEVEAAIQRALGGRSLGALIDVGTGTGRMIELLSPRAASALGIDRSPEMLRIARAKIAAAGVENGQVRQADMYALPVVDGAADTVVLHQVLHFAQDPAAAVAEAARTLGSGGRLLVADFAPHDREELRTAHAHARLGFEDEAVAGWMRAAGLEARVVEKLSGGPLTVTIWLGERAPLAIEEAA